MCTSSRSIRFHYKNVFIQNTTIIHLIQPYTIESKKNILMSSNLMSSRVLHIYMSEPMIFLYSLAFIGSTFVFHRSYCRIAIAYSEFLLRVSSDIRKLQLLYSQTLCLSSSLLLLQVCNIIFPISI
jgi:hypothetical protein